MQKGVPWSYTKECFVITKWRVICPKFSSMQQLWESLESQKSRYLWIIKSKVQGDQSRDAWNEFGNWIVVYIYISRRTLDNLNSRWGFVISAESETRSKEDFGALFEAEFCVTWSSCESHVLFAHNWMSFQSNYFVFENVQLIFTCELSTVYCTWSFR